MKNGLRPSFNYAGELVACEVWADHVEGLVSLDQPFRARIKLPYGNETRLEVCRRRVVQAEYCVPSDR